MPDGRHASLMRIAKTVHNQRHSMNAQLIEPFPSPRADIGRAIANGADSVKAMALQQHRIPKILDQEQIEPTVSDGRISLVKTKNRSLLFPVRAEIKDAIELLRQFRPKTGDPAAGIADWPDQSAGKTRIGQEIRRPNLVGRKAVAKQSMPEGLNRGEVSD